MRRWMILLAVLALAACQEEKTDTSAVAAAPAAVRAVKITTAVSRQRDIAVVEQALGRVLDPAATTIAAEVPARVLKVLVDVGDRVQRGDLLVTLDAADMQAAEATAAANLARQRAQAVAQQRQVARYRKLAKEHFVSANMLDQAEAQLLALQKSVKAAAAQLKQAKLRVQRTHIYAPVSGRVQRRWIAAGDYIGMGKPVLQLITDGEIVVSIPIPETKLEAIRPGLLVRLHLPGKQQLVKATIDDLTPLIGRSSNALAARIRMPNPGGWRPGGSVVAEIVVAVHHQAVVVPEAAVVLRPAGEVVYRIDGNRAKAQPVVSGVRQHGWVEIVRGLPAGVQLAVTGAAFLSDGAAVAIQNGGASAP